MNRAYSLDDRDAFLQCIEVISTVYIAVEVPVFGSLRHTTSLL